VSAEALLAALTVGSALIALWTDQRFPSLTPRGLMRGLLYVCAAGIALAVMGPIATDILAAPSPARVLVTLFAIALPTLTFAFLAALWMIKLALRSLAGG
jgi:hypothetical protein